MRVLSLVVCSMAGATALVWNYAEGWVDSVDDFVLRRYSGAAYKKLRYAESVVNRDPKAGVALLQDFLDDLVEVKRMDRLGRAKGLAYLSLIKTLRGLGETQRALRLAESWIAFDDHSFVALGVKAELLREVDFGSTEGWELASRMFRMVPTSPIAIDIYSEYLIDRGRYSEAFSIANRARKSQDVTQGDWYLFWSLGAGYSSKHSRMIVPRFHNGIMTFHLDLPKGVQSVRLDPPPYSRLNIVFPRIVLNEKGKARTVDVPPLVNLLTQMKQIGPVLMTSGGDDPYFGWKMPEIKTETVSGLYFTCSLEPQIPTLISRILRLPDGKAVADRVAAELPEALAQEFQSLVEKQQILDLGGAIQGKSLVLHWQGEADGKPAKQAVRRPLTGLLRGQSLAFEIDLPVKGAISHLEIELPDIRSYQFELQELLLMSSGTTVATMDLTRLEMAQLHDLKRSSNTYTVIGAAPRIKLAVPPGTGPLTSILVRGSIQ